MVWSLGKGKRRSWHTAPLSAVGLRASLLGLHVNVRSQRRDFDDGLVLGGQTVENLVV